MMDYDMFVPGNHEFNYGMTILQRQLNYLTSDGTETESSVAVGCANYLDSTKQGGRNHQLEHLERLCPLSAL